MGLVYVDMDVAPEGGPRTPVHFLVDSGASYSVLPWKVWRALGLKPNRTLEFTLADGTQIRRRASDCRFFYDGIDAPSPVILGKRNDDALLGTVTLENLSLVLNPFERTLRRMRMMLAVARARVGVRPTAHAAAPAAPPSRTAASSVRRRRSACRRS